MTLERLTREQVEQIVREARENEKRLDLSNVDLSDMTLSGMDLIRACLSQANLRGVNLNGANLREADLTRANLEEAHLMRANLSEANLLFANLKRADLTEADLTGAILSRADLRRANFFHADLTEALLIEADLSEANLAWAWLNRADLRAANLYAVRLNEADLIGANLSRAYLFWTNFSKANLTQADFTQAILRATVLAHIDLSTTKGLETVEHEDSSIIDINTIYQSRGKIPEIFLEKAGVHAAIIRWQRSLHTLPTVFICYSHKDEKEKDKLLVHLGSLERNGRLTIWHDGLIGVGTNWKEEVKEAIAQASVAILLVTPHFLTSDFIQKEEIPALLSRRKNEKELVIFPIIARPCAWKQFVWLAEMQVRPKGGKPIWGTRRDIDTELTTITNEVIEVVQNLWLPKD